MFFDLWGARRGEKDFLPEQIEKSFLKFPEPIIIVHIIRCRRTILTVKKNETKLHALFLL